MRIHAHRLVLAATALTAFVGAESPRLGPVGFLVGLFAVGGTIAFTWNRWERRHSSPETKSAAKSFVQTKRVLIAVMALGVASYVGGHATLATFSAETSNENSLASTGTLTMSDTSNATTCASFGTNTSQDNVNSGGVSPNTNYCGAAITLTNLAPGVGASASGVNTVAGMGKIVLKNTGSTDGRFLYLLAPYVNTTLTVGSPYTLGNAPPATVPVNPVRGTVTAQDTIVFSYASHTQSCKAGASISTTGVVAQGGATSIPIYGCTPATWNYAYGANTRVYDSSSDTTAANTECYDSGPTTTAGVVGATKGTDLLFNEQVPTGSTTPTNGLCQALYMWVQEQDSTGVNYCFFGQVPTVAGNPDHSQCVAPINASFVSNNTAATFNASTNTVTVSALTGNVQANDSLTISEGAKTAICTASAAAYINDATISLSGCNTYPTGSTFTAAAIVRDTTAEGLVNNDATHSITNFDTANRPNTGEISLPPVTSNGAINVNSAYQLTHSGSSTDTRTFYIGVCMIAPSATAQNNLQGETATFGLTWHLDQ
jgi:hypothetical protein